MKLIIVRHAESEHNKEGRITGQGDVPLTTEGIHQANLLAERLRYEKIDAIYASDLRRARETASIVAQHHHLPVLQDVRLREQHKGIFTGKNWKDVREAWYHIHDTAMKQGIDSWDIAVPEGESHRQVIERVQAFLADVPKNKKTVLIVAHGGTNRVILGLATGDRKKGSAFLQRIDQSNTCVNIVEREGDHDVIHLVNCIQHLPSDKKLIRIFKQVQRIPYKLSPFDPKKISEHLLFGDGRHKSTLLFNLLEREGYSVKKDIILFDWKDLPIPSKIISLLHTSTTLQEHWCVKVKIHGGYFYVDPTWNLQLERLGFPVTRRWNGLGDTQQVTKGELHYFSEEQYIRDPTMVRADEKEFHAFGKALNDWIARGL